MRLTASFFIAVIATLVLFREDKTLVNIALIVTMSVLIFTLGDVLELHHIVRKLKKGELP